MPLAGKRLTYGWALALAYHVGFRGKDLVTAVALMDAESARFPDSWHDNLDEDGHLVSTDWGLYQINDKWHDLELPYDLNPIANAELAHELYKFSQGFNPWAAYNSGAHLKFVPVVQAAWELERWRNKVPNVTKHFG